jgi:hypothetical protein
MLNVVEILQGTCHMLHHRGSFIRITALTALFVVTILGGASRTSAQSSPAAEDDGLEELDVRGVLCIDAACSEYGDVIVPFTVNAVEATSGELLGTCTVDVGNQDPLCTLSYDADVDHTFTWNDADVPDGYTAFGSPIEETGPTGDPVLTFAFAPDGTPTNINTIVVRAALCTDESCAEYAEFLSDFRITALEVQSDDAIDSCVTDGGSQYQGCTLEIPADLTYVLIWNEDAIPEGYTATGPRIDDQGPGPSVQTLTFAPSVNTEATPVASPAPSEGDTDDESVIVGLPSTGSGEAVLSVRSLIGLPGILVALSGGLVAGGVAARPPARRKRS